MTTTAQPDVTTTQQTTDSTGEQHVSTPPTDKSSLLDRQGVKPAVGFVVPIVLLIAWWAVTAAGVFTPVQLPSPSAVVDATVGLVQRGDLWSHIGISVQRVLLGFGIGAVLGMACGAVLGLSRWEIGRAHV